MPLILLTSQQAWRANLSTTGNLTSSSMLEYISTNSSQIMISRNSLKIGLDMTVGNKSHRMQGKPATSINGSSGTFLHGIASSGSPIISMGQCFEHFVWSLFVWGKFWVMHWSRVDSLTKIPQKYGIVTVSILTGVLFQLFYTKQESCVLLLPDIT